MPKLMVANRGEIAIRIFKTARRKGWTTVAIYSEADQDSMHLEYADEAYCIGAAPASQSYLHIQNIIDVAKSCQVDCIHPGYGFLSENADFVRAVHQANINFAGPDIRPMNLLGNKISAKKVAKELGIPLVPGNHHAISDLHEAQLLAQEIGFPLLIKAAAGGGGKGMRVIQSQNELEEGIQLAKAEAKASFGNDDIFIERLIASPRHIEIQIVGDKYGHVIYMPERECSLQRRHQKIMEESPANDMSPELRSKMGHDAVRLAKSCGYYSTGTVEFMVDPQGNYYFLEMNTRLQVEHTVSEMITGLDLVDIQLDIAMGMPLKLQQENIQQNGHAIQWRVYAEDPNQNFAPSTGRITQYKEPLSDHIRIDSGYRADKVVPIYYDPLISKIIAWGTNRSQCLAQLQSALRNYDILGISTSIGFGILILDRPEIKNGKYGVDFLDKNLSSILKEFTNTKQAKAAAALALYLHQLAIKNSTLPN